ncbi:alpha/beta-hydrolase family protein [Spirillospora sp. NPDC029432]|uniref:alpha/beta hydrolase n=1 Tax=Spirillospora sp. NPDC029432 TaxID=3154599 RepID=UPI003455A337
MSEPEAPAERRPRVVRRLPGFAGLAVAVLFACLSFTPSLLPRSWLLQGAISGVTAAIGYGLGAGAGALVRKAVRWRPGARGKRAAWWTLAVAGIGCFVLFDWLGALWQRDLRRQMDMEANVTRDGLLILVVTVVVFVLFVLLARALRLLTRKLVAVLGRWVPRPAAYAGAVAITVFLVVGFVEGFLFKALVNTMNETAHLANGGTTEGITRPGAAGLSGSPASYVPWDSLGVKGRDFVGRANTAAEIGRYTGRPAKEPVRVYVGLESADTTEERAELAVRELERTGAFDRRVLVIVGTTGSGWIDETVPDALEHMYGGDSAVVAVQYSYLPSWISFLTDKSKATAASEDLVRAVHARWSKEPASERPKLALFGESLGSYGTETAFDELSRLTSSTDGALLVGPPFDNPIWKQVTTGRDKGSPIWRPVVKQGRTVRFGQDPADLRSPATAWEFPRVVYLQNASDPITWWSPGLVLRPPDWLDRPRGTDVSRHMRWYPVISFWQVSADMVFANDVPDGHGHSYGANIVDGWAALLSPPGWTGEDTARLRAHLGG